MIERYKAIQKRAALWILVVGALLIVALLVLVAASAYLQSVRQANGGHHADYTRVAHWTPPPQTFLEASVRERPVPGWRLPASGLGLPADARFSTRAAPIDSRPLIGNIGERAFFRASSGRGNATTWWLVGVNVDSGQPLFSPIQLNSGDEPACFLNGPDALLCVTDDLENRTAWVVDSHSGLVTYSGPTELDVRPNDLNVQQVGMYAVAESEDEGIYGVGPMADTTWFVPGDGSAKPKYLPAHDTGEPTLAFQSARESNSFEQRLFSLSDGRVVQPDLPDGGQMDGILLFPGGFAATVATKGQPDAVMFFDDAGNRTADTNSGQSSLPPLENYFDLPFLRFEDRWDYFTIGAELVASTAEPPVRLMGSRLVFRTSEVTTREWGQYDMRTGKSGKRCGNLDMAFGYIGYDGSSVAVTADGNPTVGLTTEATDFDTCEKLWVITSPPGSFRYVWRVNTTLVQLSDDATELMSLTAPE